MFLFKIFLSRSIMLLIEIKNGFTPTSQNIIFYQSKDKLVLSSFLTNNAIFSAPMIE